jgi:hypothetical protein
MQDNRRGDVNTFGLDSNNANARLAARYCIYEVLIVSMVIMYYVYV